MINLMHGDCLERMKEIKSGSVDMILTDPPYGNVKGMLYKEMIEFNSNHDWDTCIDHEAMLAECNRILRTNGALVLFSQDPYTAKLTTDTHGNLPFSYRMTWLKDNYGHALLAKKAPLNYTEDVCVFFKKYDTLGEHPLRNSVEALVEHIGKTKKAIFSEMGHQGACKFFRYDTDQFALCTEKTYEELIKIYGIDKLENFKLYSELVKIDLNFRAKSAKVFNLHDGKKYKSNVLEYRKDYTGMHPTQKPVLLLEDLINTYTNPGDTVLDFTMGSGSTGVACINTDRNFIGIEMGDHYFKVAQQRIEDA